MKISQITISASRTVNLGNYNSLKVEGAATVTLDEHDLIDIARDAAIKEVKEQMEEAFKEFKPK